MPTPTPGKPIPVKVPQPTVASMAGEATSNSFSNAPAPPVAASATVSPEDEEDLDDYRPGGYHHVLIGDTFKSGRYTVVRKLGWGQFSTVWLAKDNHAGRHVALKVVKSDKHYTETALDEIQLLNKLSTSKLHHPGRGHVVQLLDDFRHLGPHGSHVCMVFEVLGENLLGLIKRYQHRGVPTAICQQIAKQVLQGLDYLHNQCGIIHTDLKPENILICIDDVEAVVAAELAATPAAVPTRMVGVPPSQGRGAQTPRTTAFLMGSQPLSSPIGSYSPGTSLDKFSFSFTPASTSTSGEATPAAAAAKAAKLAGKTSASAAPLSSSSTSAAGGGGLQFGQKATVGPAVQRTGPSLLSQQALHYSANPSPNDSDITINTTGASSSSSHQPPYETQQISSPGASAPSTPGLQTPSDGNPAFPPPISISTLSILDRSSPSPGGGVSGSNASTGVDGAPSSKFDGSVSHDDGARSHIPVSTDENEDDEDEEGEGAPSYPYDPQSLERITVKIADLGNACWVNHHFTNDVQTRQYRCPEIIIGANWGPTIDNWSAACLFFELVTGDYLFDPRAGPKWDKFDDHVAQIIELLGELPKDYALSGRFSNDIFNRKGELRRISKLRFWPLPTVLREKYGLVHDEADALANFLTPMLALRGDDRANARDMCGHEWLKGIKTEGEWAVERLLAFEAETGQTPGSTTSVSVMAATAMLSPVAAAAATTASKAGLPEPSSATTTQASAVVPKRKCGFDVLKEKADSIGSKEVTR